MSLGITMSYYTQIELYDINNTTKRKGALKNK